MRLSPLARRIADRRIRADGASLAHAAAIFPQIFFGPNIKGRFERAARSLVAGGRGWEFVDLGKPELETVYHYGDSQGVLLKFPMEVKNAHLALTVIGDIHPRLREAIGDNVFDPEFLGMLGIWLSGELSTDRSMLQPSAWHQEAALPQVVEAAEGRALRDVLSVQATVSGRVGQGTGQQAGVLRVKLLFR